MAIVGVTPYLYYEDADAALDWLERVLGFTGSVRWRDPEGRTTEADIMAGPAKISVSGGRAPRHPEDVLVIVNVDDADEEHARIAVAAGAPIDPPVDQPYGPRTFTVRDPWGHAWTFWQGTAFPPDS